MPRLASLTSQSLLSRGSRGAIGSVRYYSSRTDYTEDIISTLYAGGLNQFTSELNRSNIETIYGSNSFEFIQTGSYLTQGGGESVHRLTLSDVPYTYPMTVEGHFKFVQSDFTSQMLLFETLDINYSAVRLIADFDAQEFLLLVEDNNGTTSVSYPVTINYDQWYWAAAIFKTTESDGTDFCREIEVFIQNQTGETIARFTMDDTNSSLGAGINILPPQYGVSIGRIYNAYNDYRFNGYVGPIRVSSNIRYNLPLADTLHPITYFAFDDNTVGIMAADTEGVTPFAGYVIESNYWENPNRSGTTESDLFGRSMDIAGGQVWIGAPGEEYASPTQKNDGAVYVITTTQANLRQTQTPVPQTTLTNPNSDGGLRDAADLFGTTIRHLNVDGNITTFIGVPSADPSGLSNAGSVYVYDTYGSSTPTTRLDNPRNTSLDQFGQLIATTRDNNTGYLIAGAFGDRSVRIRNMTTGVWTTIADPTGSSTNRFGQDSIAGLYDFETGTSLVAVGARGFNGEGRVYIYDTSGSLVFTIDNPLDELGSAETAGFGTSLAASGKYLAVASQAAYLNKRQRVHIYDVTTQQMVSTVYNPQWWPYSNGDSFGTVMSMTGSFVGGLYLAVSAAAEDISPTRTNTGKVYLFEVLTGKHLLTLEDQRGIQLGSTGISQLLIDPFGFSFDGGTGIRIFVSKSNVSDEFYSNAGRVNIYDVDFGVDNDPDRVTGQFYFRTNRWRPGNSYSVTYTNPELGDGTYYWSGTSSVGGTIPSGSFSVTNGTGTFTVPVSGVATPTTVGFYVRSGSTSGTIIDQSERVNIV